MIDEPKPTGPMNDFAEPNECQFIHGQPRDGDWQMCAAVPTLRRYCEFHDNVVYNHAMTSQMNKAYWDRQRAGKVLLRPSTKSVRFGKK